MSESITIDYAALADVRADRPLPGEEPRTLVVFASKDLGFGEATQVSLGEDGQALIRKAAATAKFKGKVGSTMDLIAPAGFAAARRGGGGGGGGGGGQPADGGGGAR